MPDDLAASSNEIFRFVSVRGVGKPEKDAVERRFVFAEIPPNDPGLRSAIARADKAKTPITPVLLVDLPRLSNEQASEEMIVRIVEEFRTKSHNRMTPDDLDRNYPNRLHDVYLWHRDTNDLRTTSPADLLARIDKILTDFAGSTTAKFVAGDSYFDRKLRLWENLIAEYFKPTQPAFLDHLQNMIRWFWIFEKLTRHSLLDGQAVYEAMHATVVLPDGVRHSKPAILPEQEPTTAQEPGKRSHSIDQLRLNAMTHAITELTKASSRQDIDRQYELRSCKNPDDSPPDRAVVSTSRMLAARYVAALDQATHSEIDNLRIAKHDGLDVTHALERLQHERRTLADSYPVLPPPTRVANINGRLLQLDNPCHNYSQVDPCAPYTGPTLPEGSGLIRTPGVADLRVIKTTLLKYETGEIAHIENVLKGELKVREFNTLRRSEEVLLTEEETTTETEKETQTTDRFELEKEMSSMVKEDMKVDVGVKVTASFGPVSIDSHADFAYEREREESNKTATKSAREFMNRALSRVTERRRTQKTVTTILQTEDKNLHRLENTSKSSDNIHGVYYWLDKSYLAKVVNYGKRLMFEFVVPEPAAFYIYSKVNKPEVGATQVKPAAPMVVKLPHVILPDGTLQRIPLTSFEQITEENYATLAAQYDAQDVAPPDPETTVLASSLKCDAQQRDYKRGDRTTTTFPVAFASKELQVPSGYVAERGLVTVAGPGVNDSSSDLSILFGKIKLDPSVGTVGPHGYRYPQEFYPLSYDGDANTREDSFVPFAIWARDRGNLVVNIEVICRRSAHGIEKWKKQTFDSIIKAYHDRLVEYEDWEQRQLVAGGIKIEGSNPDSNRAVEKEELKKHCIEMMSGQRFESFDAMRSNVPSLMYPEFSINEAFVEGAYVQFFEQAFEWEQITYVFYPYFWGRKPNWVQIKSINDPDPVFTKFLQAGAARVLVPARPGFEKAVVHYFASNGKIWSGGSPPIPGDPLWIAVVDETKEQQGQFNGGQQEGEPWIYKMPTSLVFLADLDTPLPDKSAIYPNDVNAAMKSGGSVFS